MYGKLDYQMGKRWSSKLQATNNQTQVVDNNNFSMSSTVDYLAGLSPACPIAATNLWDVHKFQDALGTELTKIPYPKNDSSLYFCCC